MGKGAALAILIGFIVLSFFAPMACAESVDEIARGASMDFLGFDLTGAKPAYQKTAQDWLSEANAAKARCEYKSARYNEQVLAYVRKSTTDPAVIAQWERPDAEQRTYLIATGFHVTNPEAARLYAEMMDSCVAADKAYRKAYELTAGDNYQGHAEIFDEAAGVYDAVGNEEGAEEVREAADVARGHAAADAFLPLPWWLPLLGVISAVVILHCTRR